MSAFARHRNTVFYESAMTSLFAKVKGLIEKADIPLPDDEARFIANTDQNLFRGVFDSFNAAQASAPMDKPVGYDNPESAAMYLNHMQADPYDYPALFWLDRLLRDGARSVFDVGGHVGIKYYAFKNYLNYVKDLQWTVCDVPAVVERGRKIAAKRAPEGQLRFTTEYADVLGTDILFASGAIQYLPMSLESWLGPLAKKPRWILLNTSAIHPHHSFFTLNSIGNAYCPYRVTSEAHLAQQMQALNYKAIDAWKTPGKGRLDLPAQPEYSIEAYSGGLYEWQG
jgi:putative methyltransferase (TIGR04325 family)